MPVDPIVAEALARQLVKLGLQVRRRLRRSKLDDEAGRAVVGMVGGDTIFGIDQAVEATIIRAIERWPRALLPIGLIMEGVEPSPMILGGEALQDPRFWLIIDPIDGTRGLMYDKRSAMFLAAAACGSLPRPKLSDAIASVGVELPTSKQGFADILTWSVDRTVKVSRQDLRTGVASSVAARPSSARTLDQGFGCVAAFFPEGKAQAARLAEAIAQPNGAERPAQVFDDQYMSSGGQMVELVLGRDRFIVDLRPHFSHGQCAHPYDLALAPLAKAAGVVLHGADQQPLDAPFDLTTPVAWCGYANAHIEDRVAPHVLAFLAEGSPVEGQGRASGSKVEAVAKNHVGPQPEDKSAAVINAS